MEKKMVFIGSILSACILILVSLSSVVSISTISQTNNPSTPLFDTRISTALQSESTTPLSTSFIGKDSFNDMWFPKTTHTGLLLQKAQLIVKDLQNYLRSIKDIRGLTDNEVVSHTVSYLKTQEMFKNVKEGYMQALLSRHLQSTQHLGQSILIIESSGSVVDFTVETGCWLEFLYWLYLLISVIILIFLELILPTTTLKCGIPD